VPLLSVNVDHVATVRQARKGSQPCVLEGALAAEKAGAEGITCHLRMDRRHIQDADVLALKRRIRTRLNFELSLDPEIVAFALRLAPDAVCIVPENRQEVTTEGGLDVLRFYDDVQRACVRLAQAGIRVSLFIDADAEQIRASAEAGAPVIELHTGRYADTEGDEQQHELERIRAGVTAGVRHGLKVNAGHGLHYTNTQAIAAIPEIAELNIGHAIVAHAVFVGWENAVREMKALMTQARLAALRA